MFSFFRKKPIATGPVIVTATLEGREIWRVTSDAVPVKSRFAVELQSDQPTVIFTDSSGQSYAHDLSSVKADGLSWVHFDLRVSERFAVEADCLLSSSGSSQMAEHEFANHGKAIRFQPFYLPEMQVDTSELVGKGFFYRGLQFPGSISPSNVSLSCLCDFCRKSFRVECFHAGFMDMTYFFCDGGPHTLMVSSYIEGTPPLLEYASPEAVAPLEARLPPCQQCGGHFKYLNPLLCPHCHKPYIDFARFPLLRATEYYGCTLYGDNTQNWED